METYLERNKLEHLIREFLKTQPTCVVATCSENFPRATTVEFFHTGLTVYIFTEREEMVDDILENAHVSLAVYSELAGQENRARIRIIGIAETGERDSQIFEEGLDAYMRRTGNESSAIPASMNVLKIRPLEIEYLDARLEREGYHMRQTLFLE